MGNIPRRVREGSFSGYLMEPRGTSETWEEQGRRMRYERKITKFPEVAPAAITNGEEIQLYKTLRDVYVDFMRTNHIHDDLSAFLKVVDFIREKLSEPMR